MGDFDFNYWHALAERDPEGFFRARSQAIEQLIDSHAPAERARLRQLQRRIDCIRASAGCPTRAVVRLGAMIHERLSILQRQHETLEVLVGNLRNALPGREASD